MACAQDSRKLFDIFDNDTNLAQRPEENTHFDPLLPRFSPHGERRRRQREVCTCTCIRWGLFSLELGSCRWLHSITKGALDRKSSSRP